MLKSRWELAHDLKAEALPQLHSAHVRTDDEVELHRPEATASCLFLRVDAHGPGDTTAHSMSRSNVRAVADVRTTAALIRTKVVGTENVSAFLRDEDTIADRKPVRGRLVTCDIRGSVYVSPARKTGSRMRQISSASVMSADRMFTTPDYLAWCRPEMQLTRSKLTYSRRVVNWRRRRDCRHKVRSALYGQVSLGKLTVHDHWANSHDLVSDTFDRCIGC